MFCYIYKWFIPAMMTTEKNSAPASDTGLKRLVKQHVYRHLQSHLRHCPSCSRFATASAALHLKLTQDARQLLVNTPDTYIQTLNNKILAALPAFPSSMDNNPSYTWPHLPVFSFRPVIAAAVVLLAMVVIFTNLRQTTSPVAKTNMPGQARLVIPLPRLPIAESTIQQFSQTVESPLHAEIRSLKEAVFSTREFLAANLPFTL